MAVSFYEWTAEDREAFANHIAKLYGFRSRYENDLYVDARTGQVFCGSSYVCKVNRNAMGDPEQASEWVSSIAAMDGDFPMKSEPTEAELREALDVAASAHNEATRIRNAAAEKPMSKQNATDYLMACKHEERTHDELAKARSALIQFMTFGRSGQ